MAARAAILDAAERLFDERGYAGVSIADLTAASGASNGSIYHHFGSKDGVLTAIVVGALGGYQDGLLSRLDEHAADARGGVLAAVAHELAWFEGHARPARLVIAHRETVAATPVGRTALREINRPFVRGVRAWLAAQPAIPAAVDVDLMHALALAPARQIASLWLAKRISARPSSYAPALGAAAWAALQTLPSDPIGSSR
jgi:AcrR family transcriptional regulator